MSEKYRKERARDNSQSHHIRRQQDDAAGSRSRSTKPEPISDRNADEFVRNSVLDLERIAREVAQEKAEKENSDSE